MPDDRDQILSRVRGALSQLPKRAAMPDYDGAVELARSRARPIDPVAEFAERLKAVNGEFVAGPAELAASLRGHGWTTGYCEPEVWPSLAPHFDGSFAVSTEFRRERLDDYQFGITRAVGAIAETGTIILSDGASGRRLASLAPWAHVSVIPRARLYLDIPQAIAALGSDPNSIWVTGPSKTADVEGILIEGVHGPGAEIALLLG